MTTPSLPAAKFITRKIAELGDWRGVTLARMRELIRAADPEVVEEVKWMGTPVWSHGGIICTGETYKKVVKLTFAKGAALPDPGKLFNSSLEGNTRRAIDIAEGATVDAAAFKALIRAAVALNAGGAKKPVAKAKLVKAKSVEAKPVAEKPAVKTSVMKKPVNEKPATKKPAVKTTAAAKPAAKKLKPT